MLGGKQPATGSRRNAACCKHDAAESCEPIRQREMAANIHQQAQVFSQQTVVVCWATKSASPPSTSLNYPEFGRGLLQRTFEKPAGTTGPSGPARHMKQPIHPFPFPSLAHTVCRPHHPVPSYPALGLRARLYCSRVIAVH